MECRIIQGIKEGSQLLHVLPEDMLYVKKVERNGDVEWICYQTILCKPKKNKKEQSVMCTARIKQRRDGTFERMGKPHTNHTDHESIRRDMKKRNNMKTACRRIQQQHPEEAHKISERHIFQREIAQ